MKYLIEESGIYEEVEDKVDILDNDNIIEVEERTVYIDKVNNYLISVDGDGQKDHNFIKDPYFKFFKSSSAKKSDPIRISYSDNMAKYVIHNNNDDTLNSKERKYLENIMDKPSNVKDYSSYTVWEAILQATKDECDKATKEDKQKIDNITRPNFKDIKPANSKDKKGK